MGIDFELVGILISMVVGVMGYAINIYAYIVLLDNAGESYFNVTFGPFIPVYNIALLLRAAGYSPFLVLLGPFIPIALGVGFSDRYDKGPLFGLSVIVCPFLALPYIALLDN